MSLFRQIMDVLAPDKKPGSSSDFSISSAEIAAARSVALQNQTPEDVFKYQPAPPTASVLQEYTFITSATTDNVLWPSPGFNIDQFVRLPVIAGFGIYVARKGSSRDVRIEIQLQGQPAIKLGPGDSIRARFTSAQIRVISVKRSLASQQVRLIVAGTPESSWTENETADDVASAKPMQLGSVLAAVSAGNPQGQFIIHGWRRVKVVCLSTGGTLGTVVFNWVFNYPTQSTTATKSLTEDVPSGVTEFSFEIDVPFLDPGVSQAVAVAAFYLSFQTISISGTATALTVRAYGLE